MILRVGAILLLIVILAGGAWYFFRDTLQKRVTRARETYEMLLESGSEKDLLAAEELVDQVLGHQPKSVYDLMFKADLNRRKGTVEGLETALETYDKVLATGRSTSHRAALEKSLVLRQLGRPREADQSCLTVIDIYPFLATTLIADTALAEVNWQRAQSYFQRALENFALNERQEAQALEGLAKSFVLAMQTSDNLAIPDGLDSGSKAQLLLQVKDNRERFRERARTALERAIRLASDLQPDDKEMATKDMLWLARLYVELHLVRDADEIPSYDGGVAFDTKKKDLKKFMSITPPAVLAEHGHLKLRAALLEADSLPEGGSKVIIDKQIKDGEGHLLEALGNRDLDASEKLLAGSYGIVDTSGPIDTVKIRKPDPDASIEERREYVRMLARTARIYLDIGRADYLLEDACRLQMASRIQQAMACEETYVSRLFTLFQGFAYCKTSQIREARSTFAKYLEQAPPDRRQSVLVELAEQCWDLMPETSLALDYLGRFARQEASRLPTLASALRLLLRVRGSEQHRVQADSLSDQLISKLASSTHSMDQQIDVARLLGVFEGIDASVEKLRSLRRTNPRDWAVAETLTRALLASAEAKLRDSDATAALAAYQEATDLQLRLLVENPARNTDTQVLLSELFRVQRQLQSEPLASESLQEIEPLLDAGDAASIASALEHYFLGEVDKTLSDLVPITDAGSLAPFISYLRGQSYLERAKAIELRIGQVPKAERGKLRKEKNVELNKAGDEFRRHSDSYITNKLELLHLSLTKISETADVDDALFQDLFQLSKAEKVGYFGNWLWARGLFHRLVVRYKDLEYKNSEILDLYKKLQKTLRAVIAQEPGFNAAYLELARMYLAGSLDKEISSPRHLFEVQYDRAAMTLLGVPRKDVSIVRGIISYQLAEARRAQEADDFGTAQENFTRATKYREALALLEPSAETFNGLFRTYYAADRHPMVVKILNADSSLTEESLSKTEMHFYDRLSRLMSIADKAPSQRVNYVVDAVEFLRDGHDEQNRYKSLQLALTQKFEQIPEAEGVRQMHLGRLVQIKLSKTNSREALKSLTRKVIEHFDKSREAYLRIGEPVPFFVLNNLAWYLAEEEDAGSRARGLEVAIEARSRADDANVTNARATYADVFDTYAWALFQNDRYTEAQIELQELLENKERPTYRYHLAHVLYKLKQYDLAMEELEKAIRSELEFPEETSAVNLKKQIMNARQEGTSQSRSPATLGAQRS